MPTALIPLDEGCLCHLDPSNLPCFSVCLVSQRWSSCRTYGSYSQHDPRRCYPPWRWLREPYRLYGCDPRRVYSIQSASLDTFLVGSRFGIGVIGNASDTSCSFISMMVILRPRLVAIVVSLPFLELPKANLMAFASELAIFQALWIHSLFTSL